MRYRIIILTVALLNGLVSAAAFVEPPAISRVAGETVVTFSVSASTDAEVAVLDASGKVVRHLAAGVLGGTVAPPLPFDSASGLRQSVEWDGLDDDGRNLRNPPYRVRVRLGVVPVFDKRIHIRDAAIVPTVWLGACPAVPVGVQHAMGWGLDTILDTSDLIPDNHPVWFTCKAIAAYGERNPDSTYKVAFYDGGTSMLDMTVSNDNDDIVLKYEVYPATGSAGMELFPNLFRISGVTGQLVKRWAPSLINPPPYTGPVKALVTGEPEFSWNGQSILHGSATYLSGGLYRGYNQPLFRFTPDGAPLAFTSGPNVGSNVMFRPPVGSTRIRQQGLTAGPDGSIYTIRQQYVYPNYPDSAGRVSGSGALVVTQYDSVGNVLRDSIVTSTTNIQGIRVDSRGNIFLGVRMKPYPDTIPNNLKSRVTGGLSDRYSQAMRAAQFASSIVKFGPQGGSIAVNTAGPYNNQLFVHSTVTAPITIKNERLAVTGAKWVNAGSSFLTTYYTMAQCFCYNPRFDVDRFGRLVFPNPLENEYKAVDNNGNAIFRVHNRDLFKSDGIRVGLVTSVEATDRGLYLGDRTNNQILVMKWRAEAEAALDIPDSLVAVSEAALPGASPLSLRIVPNPFHSVTAVSFTLQAGTAVKAGVYDVSGRLVRELMNGTGAAGRNALVWDGRESNGKNAAAGLYLLRLTSDRFRMQRSMLLAR